MNPATLQAIRAAKPATATVHRVTGRCGKCSQNVEVPLQATVCTVGTAAEILGCSQSAVYEMIATERMPRGVWFGLGRLRRIRVERLLDWMEAGGGAS